MMDSMWQLQRPNLAGKCPLIILPVVTSLSSMSVKNSARGSSRSVAWIPLGPLQGAAEHIAQLDSRLENADESVQKALRIMCADLGEHGRMLEFLYAHLQKEGGGNLKLLLDQGIVMVSEILLALEDSCGIYLSTPSGIQGLGIVSAALIGRPVSRTLTPAGCQSSYDDLQVQGVYISSEMSGRVSSDFIPVMSPFQLLHWARETKKAQESDTLAGKVASVLLRVMKRDPSMDGYKFENFICGTTYTLSQNYFILSDQN